MKTYTLLCIIIFSLVLGNLKAEMNQYMKPKGGSFQDIFKANNDIYVYNPLVMYKQNLTTKNWETLLTVQNNGVIESAGFISTQFGDLLYYMTEQYDTYISSDAGDSWIPVSFQQDEDPSPEDYDITIYNTLSGKVIVEVYDYTTAETEISLVTLTSSFNFTLLPIYNNSITGAIDGEEGYVYLYNYSKIIKLNTENLTKLTYDELEYSIDYAFYSKGLYLISSMDNTLFKYDFDIVEKTIITDEIPFKIDNISDVEISNNEVLISSKNDLIQNPFLILKTENNTLETKPFNSDNGIFSMKSINNSIYAVGGVGVSKSNDDGMTWEHDFQDFNNLISIFSWENDNIAIFSSYLGGTIKYDKNSKEYSVMNTQNLFPLFYLFSSANNGNLIALELINDEFILKLSKDDGTTWENANIDLSFVQFSSSFPSADSKFNGDIILSIGNSIFQSTDNGENWKLFTEFQESAGYIDYDSNDNLHAAYKNIEKIDENGVETLYSHNNKILNFSITKNNSIIAVSKDDDDKLISISKKPYQEFWETRELLPSFSSDNAPFNLCIDKSGDIIAIKSGEQNYTVLGLYDKHPRTETVENDVLVSCTKTANGEILASSYFGNIYKYNSSSSVFEKVNFESENVYPNPSNLIINLTEEAKNYSILDLNSKVVLTGENTNLIDISGLNNGSYILNYTNRSGKNKYSKFIKQ